MRVLYVIPGSPTGSDQIFAKRQARALQNAGIYVSVFHLHIWTSVSVLFAELGRLRQVMQTTRPDLVHAQFGTMTGAICAFGTTEKLVITFRGSDLNPAPGTNPIRLSLGHLLSQLSALRAARIICVSRNLKERLWWAQDRVEIIPSPVDMDLFRPMPKEMARATLGWDTRAHVVLFNASHNPSGKGLHLAKAAIRVAESKLGSIQLVVLHGEVAPDNMPFYCNAADCLLMASAWEGSPSIVKEAMACNLPVVSSRVGDVEERLRGVYPSKVTERDARKLGEALIETLALKQRSNGREKIAELSIDRITQRLLAVYTDVVTKDRSRTGD